MSLHQVLPEAQRLAYLQALGVTSWLPVEGALCSYGAYYDGCPVATADALNDGADIETLTAASAEQVASEPEQAATDAPPLGLSIAQVQQQAEQMRADLVAGVSDSDSPTQVAAAPIAPVATAEPAPEVQESIAPLHLSISWYQCGVLVINELPLQDGAAMSGSLAQLQTAIINALDLGTKEVMPQTQADFFWPLVPGPHGDNSKHGGTDALAYQIGKLLQDKALTRVLLLGQRSIDLLADLDLDFGTVGSCSMWPEAKVLFTHSLHELLKIPANKAATWRHMQPLIASKN